ILEREIVVLGEIRREIVVGRLTLTTGRSGLSRTALEVASSAPSANATFASPEHHQFAGADFGRVLRHPVLVLIGAVLDFTFDVDRVALLEETLGDLGELVPEDDSMPLGLLLLLAGP